LSEDSIILNDLSNFLSEHGLAMMKEIRSEAIWSWGFSLGGVLEILINFLEHDR
jgi:hypothetical protein